MATPAAQYPSMIFFIGQQMKETTLRKLFRHNNIPRGRGQGVASLRLDNFTSRSRYPIIFGESDLRYRPPRQRSARPCHETKTYALHWPSEWKATAFDVLHAQLFIPFTDVLCLFADDFESIEQVALRLVHWAKHAPITSSACSMRARVVIVASGSSSSVTYDILQIEALCAHLSNKSQVRFAEFFSSITLVQLAEAQASPLVYSQQLKDVILKEADASRKARIDSRSLFSAVHLQTLFDLALQHVCASPMDRFDLLQAARSRSRTPADHHVTLTTFLDLTARAALPFASFASYLGSIVLLHSYPPGMHRKVGLQGYRRTTDPSRFRSSPCV